MKLKRLFAFSVVLMTLTLVVAPTAQASAQKPLHMAVLGDSYASGTGAGDYRESTVGTCWQSRNSTGEVLARWLSAYGEVTLANETCAGATINDVRHEQLGALRPDTLFVLLTAGGNDIRFADVVRQCLELNKTCAGAPIAKALNELPKMSSNMFKLLREIGQRSPMAKIVVVGYGQPMAAGSNAPGTPGVDLDPICAPEYLTLSERVSGGVLSFALDQTLRSTVEQAARHGVAATYVSPYKRPWSWKLDPLFAGRSVCDTAMSQQYYRGLDALAPPSFGGDAAGMGAVLHGNKQGYEAMATLVATKAPGTLQAFNG